MGHIVICDTCKKEIGVWEDDSLANHMSQQHDYRHHEGECHSIVYEEIDSENYEVPDSDLFCQSCGDIDCNRPFPHG